MMRFLLPLFFCMFVALPASAAEITDLRVERSEQGEHVFLQLSGKVKYKVFRIEVAPPRVVVDVEGGRMGMNPGLPADYQGTLIKAVRFGFHNEATGRLVFDLNADAAPRNIRLAPSDEGNGYWLEFDLVPANASSAPPPESHQPSSRAQSSEPHSSEPRSSEPQASESSSGESQPRPVHEAQAESRPRHSGKPVIVIDAGHGGQDPGTSGRAGTHEKDLTLRYARALQRSLLRTGRYKVFLTRDDDHYLFLRERVRLAREAHGNLFISLHADSAPTRYARGLSVYTISEKASDKESEALAAQENKVDVIGGTDLSDASEDVANILIDLTERETRAKSAEFADMAISHLGREVGLLSNTHRFAGFAVLKAPDIPSVLIEIGFLTNTQEENQLRSRDYEARVVRGITQAVDEYYRKQ